MEPARAGAEGRPGCRRGRLAAAAAIVACVAGGRGGVGVAPSRCTVEPVTTPKEQKPVNEDDIIERRIRLRRGKKRQLREYGKPLPDAIMKQMDQALNFFSNAVRVPAALLAGQAANILFRTSEPSSSAFRSAKSEPQHSGRISRRSFLFILLYRVHKLLITYSVCAELTTVLLCATAHSQILDIGREQVVLEPTALDLIIRHVEFEYVSVRIFFFSGLVALVLAFVVRTGACLVVGPRGSNLTGRRELALWTSMSLMFLSTLFWWGHVYVEEITSCCYVDSVWHFLRRFLKLLWRRIKGSPLASMSCLSAFGSMGVGVYAMTMELGVVQFDSNSQDNSPTADVTVLPDSGFTPGHSRNPSGGLLQWGSRTSLPNI